MALADIGFSMEVGTTMQEYNSTSKMAGHQLLPVCWDLHSYCLLLKSGSMLLLSKSMVLPYFKI